MNVLSWITLVLLILFALNGLRRGLIMTIFSTFSMIIAILVSVTISPYVSEAMQTTPVYDVVSQSVEQTLFKNQSSDMAFNISEQIEKIQNLPLPAPIKNGLLENNNTAIYDALGISNFQDYIVNYIAAMIVNAIAFVIVFIIISIILRIIAAGLDGLSHLPILNGLNRAGGFLLGLLNGLVIVWIACIIVTIVGTTDIGSQIYDQIHESFLLNFLYENNLIMRGISGIQAYIQK